MNKYSEFFKYLEADKNINVTAPAVTTFSLDLSKVGLGVVGQNNTCIPKLIFVEYISNQSNILNRIYIKTPSNQAISLYSLGNKSNNANLNANTAKNTATIINSTIIKSLNSNLSKLYSNGCSFTWVNNIKCLVLPPGKNISTDQEAIKAIKDNMKDPKVSRQQYIIAPSSTSNVENNKAAKSSTEFIGDTFSQGQAQLAQKSLENTTANVIKALALKTDYKLSKFTVHRIDNLKEASGIAGALSGAAAAAKNVLNTGKAALGASSAKLSNKQIEKDSDLGVRELFYEVSFSLIPTKKSAKLEQKVSESYDNSDEIYISFKESLGAATIQAFTDLAKSGVSFNSPDIVKSDAIAKFLANSLAQIFHVTKNSPNEDKKNFTRAIRNAMYEVEGAFKTDNLNKNIKDYRTAIVDFVKDNFKPSSDKTPEDTQAAASTPVDDSKENSNTAAAIPESVETLMNTATDSISKALSKATKVKYGDTIYHYTYDMLKPFSATIQPDKSFKVTATFKVIKDAGKRSAGAVAKKIAKGAGVGLAFAGGVAGAMLGKNSQR